MLSATQLNRRLRLPALLLLASNLMLSGIAAAQITDARLPISLDADSTDYDGKSSMLTFKGLKLSQGNVGIEADEGRASKLDFEDSSWKFSGNVIIDVENGHMEADSADLEFADHQLMLATINGSPATFELKRPGSDKTTYAEAGQLKYNLKTGIIEFSEEAVITENGNQISSSYLVYNITERRINAQSSGDGNKVKMTYTPVDLPDEVSGDAAEDLIEDLTENLTRSAAEDQPETESTSSDADAEADTEEENQ
jgi:lipopolysaccharide transport protein LptA